MAKKSKANNGKTLPELLQIRAALPQNKFFILLNDEYTDIINNGCQYNDMVQYVTRVINECFIKNFDELRIFFRKTDVDKSKSTADTYYWHSEEYCKKVATDLLNGKITDKEFQKSLRITELFKEKFKENKQKQNNPQYIDFALVTQYMDLISSMSKRNMFILQMWDLFKIDLSHISNSDVDKFYKKYKYDFEHTFNTHFSNPCDTSSVIPLNHDYHHGYRREDQEINGKHTIFGQVEISKLITDKKNGKKLKNEHITYLNYFEDIYNMPAGTNKTIAVFKVYDIIFDKDFSKNFIRNLNEYFNLNIDENYIVNYVIES